jgi:hypothetical protein
LLLRQTHAGGLGCICIEGNYIFAPCLVCRSFNQTVREIRFRFSQYIQRLDRGFGGQSIEHGIRAQRLFRIILCDVPHQDIGIQPDDFAFAPWAAIARYI